VIHKNEEIEYELRKSVQEAEFQRRKKEQEVQRLKDDLTRKKREDAKKIRDAIARAEQKEKELQRNLIKEKRKLDKVKEFVYIKNYIYILIFYRYTYDVKEIIHV
jgi:hypothetical protein